MKWRKTGKIVINNVISRGMENEFQKAIDIADGIEEQIKIVDSELSYPRVIKLAIYTADRMKSVIPMYTGNINPKWRQYDTVIEVLKGRLNK